MNASPYALLASGGGAPVDAPVAALTRCTIRPFSGLFRLSWDGTPAQMSGAGADLTDGAGGAS